MNNKKKAHNRICKQDCNHWTPDNKHNDTTQ
uniref:Uncharacterized protein n=1 Tax=Arundo donax TaxID=35708 RepID=A0A0A8YRQ3_ARUDO